jgi:L-seryl-tRNA(Ser) seleniumtransferase
MSKELLRALPSIESLLASPSALRLSADLSRERVRDLLRQILDEIRQQALSGSGAGSQESGVSLEAEIEERLARRAADYLRPSLRRVINATGVILHTNLGRAPLASAAVEAISEVASTYANLEYAGARRIAGSC